MTDTQSLKQIKDEIAAKVSQMTPDERISVLQDALLELSQSHGYNALQQALIRKLRESEGRLYDK
jgi:hypothetical protein